MGRRASLAGLVRRRCPVGPGSCFCRRAARAATGRCGAARLQRWTVRQRVRPHGAECATGGAAAVAARRLGGGRLITLSEERVAGFADLPAEAGGCLGCAEGRLSRRCREGVLPPAPARAPAVLHKTASGGHGWCETVLLPGQRTGCGLGRSGRGRWRDARQYGRLVICAAGCPGVVVSLSGSAWAGLSGRSRGRRAPLGSGRGRFGDVVACRLVGGCWR